MAEAPARQARRDGVTVVERAILLQQLVAAAEQPLSLRELARRADLAPSTVSRLAGTLEGLGLVERDPLGGFVVGGGARTLTGGTSDAGARGASLHIILRRVVDRFGESATTGVDTGSEVLYTGCHIGDHDVSVPDFTGQSSAFHLIASGIVLMTAWDQRRLDEYLGTELMAATEFSIIDPDLVRRRVRKAAAQGFAWSIGESIADISALAVPVRGRDGDIVAAIGLYGPSFRLSPELLDLPRQLGELVDATSTALNI